MLTKQESERLELCIQLYNLDAPVEKLRELLVTVKRSKKKIQVTK